MPEPLGPPGTRVLPAAGCNVLGPSYTGPRAPEARTQPAVGHNAASEAATSPGAPAPLLRAVLTEDLDELKRLIESFTGQGVTNRKLTAFIVNKLYQHGNTG